MGDLAGLDESRGSLGEKKAEKKRTAYEDDMKGDEAAAEEGPKKRRKIEETKDKDGLPLVNTALVVREVWLRGGSCPMKDLVKVRWQGVPLSMLDRLCRPNSEKYRLLITP